MCNRGSSSIRPAEIRDARPKSTITEDTHMLSHVLRHQLFSYFDSDFTRHRNETNSAPLNPGPTRCSSHFGDYRILAMSMRAGSHGLICTPTGPWSIYTLSVKHRIHRFKDSSASGVHSLDFSGLRFMVWEFKVLPTIAILAWADRVRVASGYIWLLALSKFVPAPRSISAAMAKVTKSNTKLPD